MISFSPNTHYNKFIVVGAGGTGSRLVPMLAQMINSHSWIPSAEIKIIDDDIVEHKNLERQLFISGDIGRSKAEVLAERYDPHYDNVSVSFVSSKLGKDAAEGTVSVKQVFQNMNIDGGGANNAVVFLCVDSVQARLDVLAGLVDMNRGLNLSISNTIVVDAGNEDIYGQVKLFNVALCRRQGRQTSALNKLSPYHGFNHKMELIPIPVNDYLGMEEGGGPSCTDLDQTMPVNALMAVTMSGIVQNLLLQIPTPFRTVRLSLDGGNVTEFLTMQTYRDMLLCEGDYSIDLIETPSTEGDLDILSAREELRQQLLGMYGHSEFNSLLSNRFFGDVSRFLAEERQEAESNEANATEAEAVSA